MEVGLFECEGEVILVNPRERCDAIVTMTPEKYAEYVEIFKRYEHMQRELFELLEDADGRERGN
jgi:hypothetical protein